jgi:hypothetical protein
VLLHVVDVAFAIVANVALAEELYCRLDEAGKVEDEEHEGEEQHEPWEQPSLDYEDELDDDPDDCDGADGHTVWEEPKTMSTSRLHLRSCLCCR